LRQLRRLREALQKAHFGGTEWIAGTAKGH
jgi:hypothetical protein